MNRSTPRTRKLAEGLLRLESSPRRSDAAETATAADRVAERLRRVLSTLIGTVGFQSLLARALSLAKAEARELRDVEVGAGGSLEGLADVESRTGTAKPSNAEVILIAHLVGLLVVFIGEALTLRVVQDAWPNDPAASHGRARPR